MKKKLIILFTIVCVAISFSSIVVFADEAEQPDVEIVSELDEETEVDEAIQDEVTEETEEVETSEIRESNQITTTGGVEGFVTRCYQIALGRDPDELGLGDWCNKLYSGDACGVSVAFGFVYSPEFSNAGFDDRTYCTKMYNMLLGREPDSAGLEYWVTRLGNGENREEVFAGFANSVEFYDLCSSYGIAAGTYIKNIGMQRNADINSFVTTLYRLCLDRDGDMGGQAMWVSGLANGTITGAEAAHGFFFSNEYILKDYSASSFVSMLYNAFLNRDGNTEEISSWADEIAAGYSSREYVFDGFANSQEFKNLCVSYGIVSGKSEYGKVNLSGREHGSVDGFDYLYQLEDIIGNRYGITIHIADEVPSNVLSLCDMDPCYNYSVIKEALILIDKSYEVYPEGFFDQLTYGAVREFHVYISGSGDAAAFTNFTDTSRYRFICYDAYSITYYPETIDHEISHCIEQAVIFNNPGSLTEEAWSEFNPEGFKYRDSYGEITNYDEYADYFISDYSMTYIEEDRAELFETAMLYYWEYQGYAIDLPEPIENKMTYYFQAIRDTFDTTTWSAVEIWEEILYN